MNVNYPELGRVDQQTRMYAEGEILLHPSGTVYKRIGGQWVLIPPTENTGPA